MTEEILDAEIKARIPLAHKKKLQRLARERHLKVADLIREALRIKLDTKEGAVTQ